MAIENSDIEPVHTADRFIGQLVFDVHRRLIRAWLARRRSRAAPAVHEMLQRWLETGQDYAHRWVLDDDGADLVCADCAPWFRDYMQDRMTGRRFTEHVPGAVGRRMLEAHLDCLHSGTPMSVLRRTHPFPERESAYEAVIAPAKATPGTGDRDSVLGHLVPFAPASIAEVLAQSGVRPDVGRRLLLEDANAS